MWSKLESEMLEVSSLHSYIYIHKTKKKGARDIIESNQCHVDTYLFLFTIEEQVFLRGIRRQRPRFHIFYFGSCFILLGSCWFLSDRLSRDWFHLFGCN